LYLSDICNKVYLVHRRDVFRAEDSWVQKLKTKNNIELVLNEEISEITGDAL
jgi:thioredoxin reductase (NADPH)